MQIIAGTPQIKLFTALFTDSIVDNILLQFLSLMIDFAETVYHIKLINK